MYRTICAACGLITALAVSIGCTGERTAEAANERPPNVIIIFTDDQGYQDVGLYGAEGYETPKLDRLAREGMHGTSFYAAASSCSPSRAALLTGRRYTEEAVGFIEAHGNEPFFLYMPHTF